MANDIFRPYTDDEKKEFTELGAITMKDRFLEQLAKVEKTFSKKGLPFDSACAKQDFDEEVRRVMAEMNAGGKNIKFKEFNLDSYGDADKFVLVSETPVIEDKLIDGMRNAVKTGVSRKYTCIKRGHGFTTFISNIALEQSAKKGKKEETSDEPVKEKKKAKKSKKKEE